MNIRVINIHQELTNVEGSNGTVYFSQDNKSAGLKLTSKLAKELNKPFVLNPTREELFNWLIDNNINILNVAGNRKSKISKEFENKVISILEYVYWELL